MEYKLPRPNKRIMMYKECFAAILLAISANASAARSLDLVLSGGRVIDGSGGASVMEDVGIRQGRIVALGDLSKTSAQRRIDVHGLAVAPGFIDVHNHSDEDVVHAEYRAAPAMIQQGVTTAVWGVDGSLDLNAFRTLKSQLAQTGVGVNFLLYIGHTGLRVTEMGMAHRAPTDVELAHMRTAVHSAMDEGALGLSTGLMYLPSFYASTDEVVALAAEAAPYKGLYDSHDRDPGFHLLDSVAECLTIARRAGLDAHVAHLKAVGIHNAGRSADLIRMIEAARARGEAVTTDVYPYDGATTRLVAEVLVPPADSPMARDLAIADASSTSESGRSAALAGVAQEWRDWLSDPVKRAQVCALTEKPPDGTFSWVKTVGYDSFRIIRSAVAGEDGRMIVDMATERAETPFDVLADLLVEQGATIKLTVGAMREDEVRALLRQPWAMVSSDGREGGLSGGRGHPRYRGSFARVLAYYVRDQHLFSLEEAVHKMSGLAAQYLKLGDRGVLRIGSAADIAVFDPQTVQDRSTWDDPALYATGMRYVFVNGVPALESGKTTDQLAGHFLPFRACSTHSAHARHSSCTQP
jgi:N-acyl-D-amino-acid deacylase